MSAFRVSVGRFRGVQGHVGPSALHPKRPTLSGLNMPRSKGSFKFSFLVA